MSAFDGDVKRAEDAASRRLAQTELARPVAIEAGAGTGKTATLVARVLAWCLGPGWDRAREEAPDAGDVRIAERVLRGVVAITFTEAAAAEMESRIEEALVDLSHGRRPVGFVGDAPGDRVAALRAGFDQLVVQTIHAWCRRLLAAFPVEAGLHPLFEVDADGTACAAAVREAVRSGLGRAYERGDEAALALMASGRGPQEIEATLVAMIAGGADAEELGRDPLAPDRVAGLRARLVAGHEALRDALGGRAEAMPKNASGARAVASSVGAALAALADVPVGAEAIAEWVARALRAWDATALGKLQKWAKGGQGEFTQGEGDALGDRVGAVHAAAAVVAPLLEHLAKLDVPLLAAMARVLAPLCEDALDRMWRRGAVSFEMLLTRADALLRNHPEVAGSLRRSIDQLLVDEFQDTDRRQCGIVAALALAGPESERPGLFLVGDPKQSIYGWRHADLAAYEALLARLAGAGGSVKPLCVNHRSVPAVLAEVERVIGEVMIQREGLQPAFQPLVPSEKLADEAGFAEGRRGVVEHWISTACEHGAPGRTRTLASATLEANALAADLRSLHDEHGVAWRDVGVLFRSRGEWDLYLRALREADVPYAVEGDRTYYRRREILDAAALTCSILDPNDQIALVALLRSSVAGVPDAAWIPLWEGRLPRLAARLGGSAPPLDEIAALLADAAKAVADTPGVETVAGWEHTAFACLETLDALRTSFARDPADRFVERARDALGFELGEAARFQGAWRAANLERFFDDLAAALSDATPVSEVLRRIRSAVAEEEVPSVEPKAPATEDAVTVVTLHGAKGLAWDHVYLMQLHKGSRNDAPVDAVGRVDDRFEATWSGLRTLGYDAVEARAKAVAEAEQVRTLYVGMTRAKRRLVLAGVPRGFGAASDGTHASLLAQRRPAPPPVDELAREAAQSAGRVRAADACWVFPALAGADATVRAPAARSEPPWTPPAPAPLDPAFAARMATPRGVSVSTLAADEPGETAIGPPRGGVGEAWGRRVGTAIHAALERLDLHAPIASQWDRERERITAALRADAPVRQRDEAIDDARACWDRLRSARLVERLFSLADRVVARELPILLLPAALAPNALAPPATGYVSGAIDLVYRDPDGRLVVVDYKTDRERHDAGSPARARYLRQGELYCRALAEALPGDLPPRFEIWWLRHDRVDPADPIEPPPPGQLPLAL